MVTNIKTAERTSINSASDKDAEKIALRVQGEGLKTGRVLIAEAIKQRTSSFASLATAAAHSVHFFCSYGRTELMNELFSGLLKDRKTVTDAENFRTLFIPRLIELYGEGGSKAEDGTVLKLNVPFIGYTTAGKDNGEYWIARKLSKEHADYNRVKATNARIAAEIVEALSGIAWTTPDRVNRPEPMYSRTKLLQNLKRELIKAAKASADPESNISEAFIEMLMRDAGFERDMKTEVRDAFPVGGDKVVPLMGNSQTPKQAEEGEKHQAVA